MSSTRYGLLLAIIANCLIAGHTSEAAPVVIKSGNVIGSPLPGEIHHHMLQTQHDFAELVSFETNGAVDLQILEKSTCAAQLRAYIEAMRSL